MGLITDSALCVWPNRQMCIMV